MASNIQIKITADTSGAVYGIEEAALAMMRWLYGAMRFFMPSYWSIYVRRAIR